MPLICTVGDLLADIIVRLNSDPQRGTDTPAKIEFKRGGSAANVAVAVAAAGGHARFIGQIGDDFVATMLAEELSSHGVDLRIVRSGTTGTIVVLVDSTGERSFLTDRAAVLQLANVPATDLDDVDWLHVPAYSLTTGILAETVQHLIGDAVERQIPISLSTSSVSVLSEFGRERFLDLVKAVQPEVVIANRAEANYLLQGHPWFRHSKATVVTAEDRPARFVRPDGSETRVSPETVEVMDSTGAGDAFTGAFLVAYASGASPEACLQAGHDMARRTLEHPGAGLGDISNG
jgi:sugar/nucleoside kinase (ribokinase family)